MEVEAQKLLEELRAAQEEHAHALKAANNVRDTLANARKEYEDARAAEKAGEDDLARGAETLARGLQSLALQPTIVDSLVEYHANIGCYQCYLFLDCHKDGEKQEDTTSALEVKRLAVRVEFPRVELTYKPIDDSEEDRIVWWTEIERNVDVSQCTVEEKDDHWYLRLPIRLSDKQPLGGFSSFTQVSSVELRPESYVSVCCRSCNELLLGGEDKPLSIEKVLPLPSANWMDMFDFWGAGIGAFEHIPRDDIHSQRQRVLVGESYVLLHARDLVQEATVTDQQDKAAVAPGDNAKEEREWIPLACTACSARVGLCSVEHPETIRLHKHLISAYPRSNSKTDEGINSKQPSLLEDNVFTKYTVDSILSAKLLEMADSDGIFRFILTSSDQYDQDLLCGVESNAPASTLPAEELQLQLLSWETMIKQKDSTQFCRVLKVLYGPRQPISSLLPSQEVSLPPAMCLTIAKRLRASSTLLPSSLRAFNGMHVGYLFA